MLVETVDCELRVLVTYWFNTNEW